MPTGSIFRTLSMTLLGSGMFACTPLPASEQPASLPPGVYGVYLDNDTGAINYAAWAFASEDNLRNNPVAAAKALVALIYLPEELRRNPRFIQVDSAIAVHMDDARTRLRQVLAILPTASNQDVIDALLGVAATLQGRNQTAVLQSLQSPVFTLPPSRTLSVLANLPYNEEANLATARALGQSDGLGGTRS